MEQRKTARDAANKPKPSPWAELLKKSREAAGLTQATVSAAVGIGQVQLSRFESGEADLEIPTILKIKDFLDPYQVKYLLGDLFSPKAGGVTTSLSALAHDHFVAVPPGGKLTEHIASELEARRVRLEAADEKRKLAEELPALRKKVAHYEMLLARDTELIQSMNAEILKLKAKKKTKRPRGRR